MTSLKLRSAFAGSSGTIVAVLLAASASGSGTVASAQSGVTLLEPCATRIIVRNASALEHELSWRDPASGARVQHRAPPRTDTRFPYVALVVRIPAGEEISIDGRPAQYLRSTTPCVAPLPANAPDSLPADYGLHNALLPSFTAGVRFPGIVILSFATTTTPAQRDSIVLGERLELVGGYRIGYEGFGLWAFWIPDDREATNARALADRLGALAGIRSAGLTGLMPGVP